MFDYWRKGFLIEQLVVLNSIISSLVLINVLFGHTLRLSIRKMLCFLYSLASWKCCLLSSIIARCFCFLVMRLMMLFTVFTCWCADKQQTNKQTNTHGIYNCKTITDGYWPSCLTRSVPDLWQSHTHTHTHTHKHTLTLVSFTVEPLCSPAAAIYSNQRLAESKITFADTIIHSRVRATCDLCRAMVTAHRGLCSATRFRNPTVLSVKQTARRSRPMNTLVDEFVQASFGFCVGQLRSTESLIFAGWISSCIISVSLQVYDSSLLAIIPALSCLFAPLHKSVLRFIRPGLTSHLHFSVIVTKSLIHIISSASSPLCQHRSPGRAAIQTVCYWQ